MAAEELGLIIAVKGFARFISDMKAGDTAIGKMATGWQKAGGAAGGAMGKFTALSRSVSVMATKTETVLTAIRPLGIAFSAMAASGALLIRSSTMLAARNEELAIVLLAVGKNAGYTEKQLTEYESAIKGLGITTQSARQSMVQMMQANIDLAHATDLARLAQDAAVIAQVDSSEAFSRLITIIQTGNVLMGRRLGLNLDFAGSNKRMAASLGITVDALTQEQRMQARVNEVMAQGTRIAGTYEAAMGSAGKQMRSLNRHWEEARASLGTAFLPMLSRAVKVVGDVLKAFNSLDASTKKTVGSLLALGTGFSAVAGSIILVGPRIIRLGRSLAVFIPLVLDAGAAFQLLAAGETAAGVASLGFAGVLAVALPAILAVAAATAALIAMHKTAVAVEEHHTDVSDAWVDSLQRQVEQGKSATEIAREYASAQKGVNDTIAESSSIATMFVNTQKLQLDSTASLSSALAQSSDSYEEYTTAMQTAIAATDFQIDAEGNLIEITQQYGREIEKVVRENFLLSESEFEVANSIGVTAETMTHAATITDGWASTLSGAALAANGTSEAVDNLDQRIDELKEALAGPVREENEKYWNAQDQIREKIDETTQALSDAQVEFGIASEEASVHKGKLADLRGELGELSTAHREAMNQIVYDMMMARLAVDGWTEAEVNLALEVARSMGLVDEETWAAATAMNAALTGFATGIGQAETKATITEIASGLAAIPRTIDVTIRIREELATPITAPGRQGGETYQQGTPFVPRTGQAFLHRGEAVLPVPMAAAFRQIIESNDNRQFNLNTTTTMRPGGLAMEFTRFEMASR